MFVLKPRKPALYEEARSLRERGLPYKRIAARLGISPATAHAWTSDIALSPEQVQRNLTGPTGPQSPKLIARRTEAIRRSYRSRRLAAQQEGCERARGGDPLHQAGCMLYWAEGSKERNSLILANSDPNMLRFFCRFLRSSFGVRSDEITIRVNAYTGNGLSMSEIERWWLELLELPESSLRKGIENHSPTSSSGKRRNKLPRGVCTVRLMRSTHVLQHIYGAIQEYAGFEEPRWLDGPPRKPRTRGS